MEQEILNYFSKRLEGFDNKKSFYRQVRLPVDLLKTDARATAFKMVEEGLLQYHGLNETWKPYFQLKKKGFGRLYK